MTAEHPWEQSERAAMERVYLSHGALSAEQVDLLVDDARALAELELPGLRWTPMDQVLSVYRLIPLQVHYEAMAAGLGIPFRGILHYHSERIRRGLDPAWRLNQTRFHQPPEERMPIGSLMVALGLVDEAIQEASLALQQTIEERVGVRPALGSLLLCLGKVSYPDFYQVLGMQAKIPFVDLDQSAPLIFDGLGRQLASGSPSGPTGGR